jgi:hypothetical protein
MQRVVLWLWILASIFWLVLPVWIISQNWSDDQNWSRERVVFARPWGWGDQHPECRDRLGFWPDGSRMSEEVLSEVRDIVDGIIDRTNPRIKTPDEVALEEWARDIREKIASCEEAQWLPIEKANAIREDRIRLVAFALLPPITIFLLGAATLWVRKRLGGWWHRLGIPTVPRNVQRGLLRLYLVISVPWVAWFGYHILGALDRHRPVSGAVWSLLIVPIGSPLLYLAAVWVIAGFRMAPEVRPKADEAPPRSEPPSHRPPADYYPVIARAVSGLASDTPEARQTLYDRARTMLIAQLHERDQLQIECERRALEDAIRRVENQRKAPESLAKEPSTALLVASIILLSKLWVLDPTSMSLYWVARLPRR